MKDILVSIVIPVYQTENYIYESVDSALSQSYPHIELILVDDGSPDRCPEILDEYAAKYENIRVYHQENKGRGLSRNTGLFAARGEYVFFMDSDDKLDGSEAIACLVKKALEENADIVVGNYRKFQGNQILDVNMHHLRAGEYTETADFRFEGFYRYGHLAYNWGKLYRRAFLMENKLFSRAYPFTQDKAHNILCYAYHPRYAFVNDSVYLYRVNDESITFRYKENLAPVWISIASDFRDTLKERGIEEDYGDITAFHIFFGSFFLVKQELTAGKGIRKAAEAVRKYGEDPFVAEAMGKLAEGKYVKDISSLSWKVMIRLAAVLFHIGGYFLFTCGIAMLRGLRIDGIISDKRNKRKHSVIKESREDNKRTGGDTSEGHQLREEVICLCACLRAALAGEELGEREKDFLLHSGVENMVSLAEQHRVLSMIYDILAEYEEKISPGAMEIAQRAAEKTVRQSYRLLFLTKGLVERLAKADIPVVVLKGCGVASYYPVPEYRKSGDVDLLFENMEHVLAAGKVMEEMGYHVSEEQHSNHHLVYQNAAGTDIELHAMLAEPFDDEMINQKMDELLPEYFRTVGSTESMGVTIPTTSDPLQALELLLHMLQHFLRAGFGLKLLTDWVVFWNQKTDEKTSARFRELVESFGVDGFAKAVTLVCEKYLGLRRGIVYGMDLEQAFSKQYAEQFLIDIVDAEEFGKADKNRMVALRKRGMLAYIKEFHYQMRMNYPKESKKKWKWPYLWVKTFVVFMKNNKRLNRGSLGDILKNAGQRAGVVEQMKLFHK